ncbi:hypothetical protein PGT21_025730 [Puccinia graminis f. sp. tritici]|uniref:Uncharacterized protein n=1 Tax=Puccinia graminis f. sp. tritici TaxID=56615 RepID=A0A5B0NLX8_PUCGR|nr:hypothetical protein PGT21_025730 [Puccinia graminis f. sp. tritici]
MRPITQEFTPRYAKSEPLIRCVHNFAAILSQPTVRTKPAEELYGDILELAGKLFFV